MLRLLLGMEDSRRVFIIAGVSSEELVYRLRPAVEIELMREESDYCYAPGVEYYRSFA